MMGWHRVPGCCRGQVLRVSATLMSLSGIVLSFTYQYIIPVPNNDYLQYKSMQNSLVTSALTPPIQQTPPSPGTYKPVEEESTMK